MLIFSIALLFLLACMSAWCLIFPGGRDAVLAPLVAFLQRVSQGRRRFRRQVLLATVMLLIVTLPAAGIFLSGARIHLPGFAEDSGAMDGRIADLLRGEQLAPPSPLPPEVFTTAEVALARPMLDGANRDWALLDREFTQRLLWVFRTMREQHGYEMVMLEGYRSPERQNRLAGAGTHVTAARAFQSYHQSGLAADCAFLRGGQVVISERDEWAMRGYELYGRLAEAAGLTWGGRWAMRDFGHAELRHRR
ncbi:M15 family metallopeptidase [Massilia endophytica]|uniref:M15 family metallopeptidase n=1 Tax=Massilia endophytica TaxID=2899220 RepID=UPI001E29BB76|nr:M15 family metallopeptidase [Massilia endophytica]UGQ44838.1 M15 family metallopeptidase [Massilia endophytica]